MLHPGFEGSKIVMLEKGVNGCSQLTESELTQSGSSRLEAPLPGWIEATSEIDENYQQNFRDTLCRTLIFHKKWCIYLSDANITSHFGPVPSWVITWGHIFARSVPRRKVPET